MRRVFVAWAVASLFVISCGPSTPPTEGDGGTPTDDGGSGCEAGARRCLDPRTAQSCDADGLLWEDVPCATGTACQDGLCLRQICEPGATRCTPDGLGLEQCNAAGTAWAAEDCPSPGACLEGACVTYTCQPGHSRCASDTMVEVCVTDGSGWAADACNTGAGEGCYAGVCRVPLCTPGETRCANETTVQTCAADAARWTSSSCPSPGACREGTCVNLACEPGARRCAGAAAYEECAEDGSGWISGTCPSGESCAGGWCGDTCGDVYDCDVGQLCTAGLCVADTGAGCTDDAGCPQDHVCEAFFGMCVGCQNDGHCVGSPNGPRCDTTDDGEGPGGGYCYAECGTGVGGCDAGMVCDETRGGLCVPACTTNAECDGGLVCIDATYCGPCESDTQCGAGMTCTQSGCVEDVGCTDAQCQQNLGAAYFCDPATDACVLGCTAPGCNTSDAANCNPCSDGSTCDTATHECQGTGCTACPDDCSVLGTNCDLVTCQCVTPGGTGDGVEGDTCMTDDDCVSGLGCAGGMASLGLPGTCAVVCSMDTNLCACPDPGDVCTRLTSDSIGLIACMMGMSGYCRTP